MEPVDKCDISFKDEGEFWFITPQTAVGHSFMQAPHKARTPAVSKDRFRPNIFLAGRAVACELMEQAQAAGLSVDEF